MKVSELNGLKTDYVGRALAVLFFCGLGVFIYMHINGPFRFIFQSDTEFEIGTCYSETEPGNPFENIGGRYICVTDISGPWIQYYLVHQYDGRLVCSGTKSSGESWIMGKFHSKTDRFTMGLCK